MEDGNMSANLTVGATAVSANADKVSWAGLSRDKSAETQAPSSQSDKVANLQSLKDLETAQLRGESIPVSDQQLIKDIEKAVKAAQGPSTTFNISFHRASNELQIKVFNKDTGELIREIPPEQTLNIVANLRREAGIIVDERR